jgi:N-acetylneuraminate synthase
VNRVVTIGGHRIGDGQPTFVIAEAGVNHNGDMAIARELIDIAADAGADAVKFQTFDVGALVTRAAPKARYQAANTRAEGSQYEMLQALRLPPGEHEALRRHCEQRGVMFLSSPFDAGSLDFLVKFGVAAIKVPSGEITNHPLLARAARSGLPLIVSTGMSTLAEVDAARRVLDEAGCKDLVLLHCVSDYPAAPAEANLRAMETMRREFDVPVGFSDHTTGIAVATAAVALGAAAIEKHFTVERPLEGPDHAASLKPAELKAMIAAIRTVETALGDGIKRPQRSEAATADVARKSLVWARDLPAGTRIEEASIAIKRPGTGMPPARLGDVLGRVTARAVQTDALVDPKHDLRP